MTNQWFVTKLSLQVMSYEVWTYESLVWVSRGEGHTLAKACTILITYSYYYYEYHTAQDTTHTSY